VRRDLTLFEVLALAGLEVPAIRIRSRDGLARAVFDPALGSLTPLDAGAQGAGPLAPGTFTVQPRTQRGPSRHGGAVVLRSIAPLAFGALALQWLELRDEKGAAWRLHPGYLEDPNQRVVAWFDAPVPPAVASWVARRFAERPTPQVTGP
jgi:hypothetical protein